MKLCQIYNFAPHYRSSIYQMIDKTFECEFVFGDNEDNIKKMDYTLLTHRVSEVKNIHFKYGYYQKGVQSLLNEDFDTFLMTGDIRCISTWLFAFRSLFYPNKKVFFWNHGLTGKENWLRMLINKVFFGLCDGAFIYNETGKNYMVKKGFSAQKLYTIYNSLDYDAQLSIRESLTPSGLYKNHFNNDNKNIIFIGRLTPVKKFNLLIDAVAINKKKGKKYNLTFIGDGTEREQMKYKINELGIDDQVWFYGACYDENTNAELIYNADLCVSPGNIGLTAMHVMMFGCPAITNDDFEHQMPEFEAIVENETGQFFLHDNAESLASTIESWFTSHKDDREDIRKACYDVIDKKWNPHNQINILKRVLLQNE